MDLVELEEKRAKLRADMAELNKLSEAAGLKPVHVSDTAHKGWKLPIYQMIQRLDPEAAADPKLNISLDRDKFGGATQKRALMLRRFVHGNHFTGKGLLPDDKLNDPEALEKAVSDALAEAEQLGRDARGNGTAFDQAQRDLAEERVARELESKRMQAQIDELSAMIRTLTATKGEQPAPPTTREPRAEPEPLPTVDPLGPPLPVPDEPKPPAAKAKAKPAVPSAFAPKRRSRGASKKK